MTKRGDGQENKYHVRAYYQRNKSTVVYRKVMARCREHGSVPRADTVEQYQIPILALKVAFAEFAATCPSASKIRQCQRKLASLRAFMTQKKDTELKATVVH